MTRSISWRRHKEEIKVISRLKSRRYSRWRYMDANGIKVYNVNWVDLIGTYDQFRSKTMTTDYWSSRSKGKYGKRNKSHCYSKEGEKRCKDKDNFIKELKKELEEWTSIN